MNKSQYLPLYIGLFFASCVIVWTVQFFIEHDEAFACGIAMGVVSMLGPTSVLSSIKDRLIAFAGFFAVVLLTYVLYWLFPDKYPTPIVTVAGVLIAFPFIFIRVSQVESLFTPVKDRKES